jgi:hypothetical protein
MAVAIKINGRDHSVDVDGDTPLLWVLCGVHQSPRGQARQEGIREAFAELLADLASTYRTAAG